MLVYGRNVAREILRNHKKVVKIILQKSFDDKEIISLIEKYKIKVEYRTKQQIDCLVDGNHQGIILSIPDYKYKKLDEILLENPNFLVLLDHLEDPHNLGAIIRTCEASSSRLRKFCRIGNSNRISSPSRRARRRRTPWR